MEHKKSTDVKQLMLLNSQRQLQPKKITEMSIDDIAGEWTILAKNVQDLFNGLIVPSNYDYLQLQEGVNRINAWIKGRAIDAYCSQIKLKCAKSTPSTRQFVELVHLKKLYNTVNIKCVRDGSNIDCNRVVVTTTLKSLSIKEWAAGLIDYTDRINNIINDTDFIATINGSGDKKRVEFYQACWNASAISSIKGDANGEGVIKWRDGWSMLDMIPFMDDVFRNMTKDVRTQFINNPTPLLVAKKEG